MPLFGPVIERRVGLIHLAQHRLSSAAQALAGVIEREMAASQSSTL